MENKENILLPNSFKRMNKTELKFAIDILNLSKREIECLNEHINGGFSDTNKTKERLKITEQTYINYLTKINRKLSSYNNKIKRGIKINKFDDLD